MKNCFTKITSILITGIMLVLPFFSLAVSLDDLKNEIQQKQAEIQELEKQIAAYKEEIKSKKAQETTLAKQINYMEAQIKRLETEIKLTKTKISATSLRIDQLTADINTKNIEIERQKNNLGQILRTIYEFDQETPLALVLKNANFSDFLNQVQFIESLEKNVKAKLDYIKALKQNLESEKTDFEVQKNALEDLRDELSGQNLVIGNQKDEKEDLLVKTKSQEKRYQQMLSDLQKKREEIQREIYLLEDKLRLTIDPNTIPAARAGLLAWPIKGVITQKYGPTSETGFINEAYKFHNGIDIEADVGDPIRAALDGVVKARGDNGRYAYGKWIAIEHENGLITLYAHLSAYGATVGQKVKTGQVIGYAGNTGFSTGPHLHFTVYASTTFMVQDKWYGLLPLGGPINPMSYL